MWNVLEQHRIRGTKNVYKKKIYKKKKVYKAFSSISKEYSWRKNFEVYNLSKVK